MGIQGLIPFLKKASRPCNIKEFKGGVVAIDSYCWLHKGAFACAEKLALGEKTDQYVLYCMKYVNSLLSFGVKPIMVFDGCRLPSKKEVEQTRRDRRNANRKKAAQLLREGKKSEARDCLVQCIDITADMALELINACRLRGVDCIVAPYEADAQLAYLNKIGVADVIITEDSDLVLFGCDRILFKMDVSGNGLLVEKSKLNLAVDIPADQYTFEKFQRICILSGCDYLPSLPGIGLAKATKVFKLSRQANMKQVLKKIPMLLKMPSLLVSDEYIDNFFKAENTFLYQLVYDPLKRKLVPLNPLPSHLMGQDLYYAGPPIPEDHALQIALGNINVNNGQRMAYYNPDDDKMTSNPNAESIWSKNGYFTRNVQSSNMITVDDFNTTNKKPMERPTTKGKEVVVEVPRNKATSRFSGNSPKTKTIKIIKNEADVLPSDSQLLQLYSNNDISIGNVHDDNDHDPINKTTGNSDDNLSPSFTVEACQSVKYIDNDKENSDDSLANNTDLKAHLHNNDNNLNDDNLNVDASHIKTPLKASNKITSPKKFNIFAVNKDGGVSEEDKPNDGNNDSSKKKSIIHKTDREIKSRFFVASPEPARESEFFVRLKQNDQPISDDHLKFGDVVSSDDVDIWEVDDQHLGISPRTPKSNKSIKSKLSMFAHKQVSNVKTTTTFHDSMNSNKMITTDVVIVNEDVTHFNKSKQNCTFNNGISIDKFNKDHININGNVNEPLAKKVKFDSASEMITPKNNVDSESVDDDDDDDDEYEKESPFSPSMLSKRIHHDKVKKSLLGKFSSHDNNAIHKNESDNYHDSENPLTLNKVKHPPLFSFRKVNLNNEKHGCDDDYEDESIIPGDDIYEENPLGSLYNFKGSTVKDKCNNLNGTNFKQMKNNYYSINNNNNNNNNKNNNNNNNRGCKPSGLSKKNSKLKPNANQKSKHMDDRQQTLSNFFHSNFSLNKSLQKFSL